MEQDELKALAEKRFNAYKKEHDLKTSLEEIDNICFYYDLVYQTGFVSDDIGTSIRGRITDLFGQWAFALQNVLMPNPASMIDAKEATNFTDLEKQEIEKLLNEIYYLIRKSTVIGLQKDKKAEAKLIDELVGLWNDRLKKAFIELEEKHVKFWDDQRNGKNPVSKDRMMY